MATPSIGHYGAPLNLRIKQGATFSPTIILQNPDGSFVNLTGSQVRAQIRKNALDAAVAASFVIDILNAVGGEFKMTLTDEVTAAITAGEMLTSTASKYVWDCEMEDSLGRVTPLFYGQVDVFREVTRTT